MSQAKQSRFKALLLSALAAGICALVLSTTISATRVNTVNQATLGAQYTVTKEFLLPTNTPAATLESADDTEYSPLGYCVIHPDSIIRRLEWSQTPSPGAPNDIALYQVRLSLLDNDCPSAVFYIKATNAYMRTIFERDMERRW